MVMFDVIGQVTYFITYNHKCRNHDLMLISCVFLAQYDLMVRFGVIGQVTHFLTYIHRCLTSVVAIEIAQASRCNDVTHAIEF